MALEERRSRRRRSGLASQESSAPRSEAQRNRSHTGRYEADLLGRPVRKIEYPTSDEGASIIHPAHHAPSTIAHRNQGAEPCATVSASHRVHVEAFAIGRPLTVVLLAVVAGLTGVCRVCIDHSQKHKNVLNHGWLPWWSEDLRWCVRQWTDGGPSFSGLPSWRRTPATRYPVRVGARRRRGGVGLRPSPMQLRFSRSGTSFVPKKDRAPAFRRLQPTHRIRRRPVWGSLPGEEQYWLEPQRSWRW